MWLAKKQLIFGVAICLSSTIVTAQSSRDQARRTDLAFVSTQIPKLHNNFFFTLKQADFNQAVAAFDAQIPTLTDPEFYVGLAKLVAMAGDAHTYLSLDGNAAGNAGFRAFPLQFRWFDDGLFVTAAAPPYTRALGMRVVRVGNSPIEDVVKLMGTVIPHS